MAANRRKASSLGNTPPPDRAAGLADGWDTPVAPVTPLASVPAAEMEEVPSSPAPTVVEPPTPAVAKPAPPRRGARRKPAQRPPIVSGRIPEELFRRINAAREESGDTHEQFFARALDGVYDDLRAHYQARSVQTGRVPIPQRRSRRPGGESMTQYPLRLAPEVTAVLTELMDELDPPSQSEFLTTIMRLRLDQIEH